MKGVKKTTPASKKSLRKARNDAARRAALVDDVLMDGKRYHGGVTVFEQLARRRKSRKTTAA